MIVNRQGHITREQAIGAAIGGAIAGSVYGLVCAFDTVNWVRSDWASVR